MRREKNKENNGIKKFAVRKNLCVPTWLGSAQMPTSFRGSPFPFFFFFFVI